VLPLSSAQTEDGRHYVILKRLFPEAARQAQEFFVSGFALRFIFTNTAYK